MHLSKLNVQTSSLYENVNLPRSALSISMLVSELVSLQARRDLHHFSRPRRERHFCNKLDPGRPESREQFTPTG